ncbi:unnamed protein product [Orchesella dallaii]|uniref:Uncharacterized protein n=1 Tax=Orchesella dallaii TaxID=48710 RepID=A0ABP1QF23_9HEXA
MDICPVVIVGRVLELIKEKYPGRSESKPNEKEELVAQQMVDCLHGFVTDSLFEDDEDLEEIPDSQVSSYSQQLIVDDGGKEKNHFQLVSKREVASMESILEAATKFQQTIKRISPQYPSHLVLNTDQVGFMYELTGNRTLSHTGEKLTVACATSPTNLATHSYTCQYVISLAGTIVGDVFLCLQERTARLSETVKKKLFAAPNVTITCSSSGKLTTSLYEYFLDNVILTNVREYFLYIIDSWAGQTNVTSYNDRFDSEDSVSCNLKLIPKSVPACVSHWIRLFTGNLNTLHVQFLPKL